MGEIINKGGNEEGTTLNVSNKSRRLTADDVYDESSVDTYELHVFGDEQQQQTPQSEGYLLLRQRQRHQEDGYYLGRQRTYEACLDETCV